MVEGLDNGLGVGLDNGLYDGLSQNDAGKFLIDDINFNNGAVPTLTGSASTGGAFANARWTLRPAGYSYTSAYWTLTNMNAQTATNPYSGGSFMFTNSDAQGSPGTNVTNEWMIFGPYDLRSFSTINMIINSYLRYIPGNQVRIEWIQTTDIVSRNIATPTNPAWNIFTTFLATHGSAGIFTQINIFPNTTYGSAGGVSPSPSTSYNGLQPWGKNNVYFRFRFNASWDYGWAISRIRILGTK
jgi:hypothetical protein